VKKLNIFFCKKLMDNIQFLEFLRDKTKFNTGWLIVDRQICGRSVILTLWDLALMKPYMGTFRRGIFYLSLDDDNGEEVMREYGAEDIGIIFS
jgi:hypothetical protein